ncbi:MAG: ROK family protein [Acidimicrobiales bacterium]
MSATEPDRRARDRPPTGSPSSRGGLLSSSDVGAANRSRVLQALFEGGPTSRADLARRINVPRATVSSIVNGLLQALILVEGDAQPPAKGIGKPARPLSFAPEALLCGAVAVSRGLVETAVVDARGELLVRNRDTLPAGCSRRELERRVLDTAQGALAGYRGRLLGIGLTVPALCDPAAGEVLACTAVPGLVGSALPGLLERRFGAPVRLEQDVRAFAIGEKWFGQGRGRTDFAALQVDLGVGAGVMLPGHLLEGARGYTTQLGHTCVDRNGDRCRCGLRGCWETVASTRWLRSESARRGIVGGRATTPGRLAKRASAGDAAAQQLLDEYADNLALGMASLVQLLSLRLFIVHGAVVRAGEAFRAELERRVVARSMPALADGIEVLFSELDQDSGLLGAAAIVLGIAL